MFKGLNRVFYQVPDLEQAKSWYCKILGQKPVLDSPLAVHFRIGDSGLTIVPGKKGLENQPEDIIAYWEVEDADGSFRDLIAAGCVFHQAVITVFNLRLGSVIDPFGNIIGLLSYLPEKHEKPGPVEEQPSETALVVASLRALAAHDEREEIRGGDNLAELFLTEERKKPLTDRKLRDWILQNAVPDGMYEYLIARTAYFDFAVKGALKENIPQIVFIGAGYDSRPYRFYKLTQSTKIFELDAKPTQERKLALLRQAGIPIPENLTLVPADFNKERLKEILAGTGFHLDQRTLFIWEGVTFYLTAPVIDDVLACIVNISPPGSEICFDFQSYSEGDHLFETRSPGEPIRFGIPAGTLEAFLSERGFQAVDLVTAQEMERRYLTLKDGTLVGNINPLLHFVRAEVG